MDHYTECLWAFTLYVTYCDNESLLCISFAFMRTLV